MRRSKEQTLKGLVSRAEGAFRELLAWVEEHPHATLAEIEDRVGELRGDLLASAIEGVIGLRGEGFQADGVKCQGCGKPMRFQGYREKVVQTTEGVIRVPRAYYYCPDCKEGLFPPR